MRVLLVTKHYPPPWGGIQKLAVDVERSLHYHKHSVDLLNGDAHTAKLWNLVRFQDFFWTRATWNETFGVRALSPFALFSPTGYREMVYNNIVYRMAKERMRQHSSQLLQLLSIESYAALFAAPLATPVVVHAHAEEITRGAPLRLCAERADIILCSSQYGARTVAELQPQYTSKIRVLYPSIDTEGYTARTKASRDPSIVTVARLDTRKNIDTVIRAFALIYRDLPEATLTIIGDGPERNVLEALAQQLAPGKIRFLGWVSEAHKRDVLSRARIFALCPKMRDDRAEGFGISFLEAQAAGTPIVGSAVGGVPESAGPHSILVADPLDAAVIAAALKQLWTQPKQWTKQHTAGLKYVKQFTSKAYSTGLFLTYKEAQEQRSKILALSSR